MCFKLVINKKIISILFFFIITPCLSQHTDELMSKLKNVKELFEMDLISEKDYDSISTYLVDLIMNNKSELEIKNQDSRFVTNNLEQQNSNEVEEENKLNFSFDELYTNEFIYNGRMIKELGYGGILVSTSLREVRRNDGKYYIFDISISNNSKEILNFTTDNINAIIYAKNGKSINIKGLTRKEYMKIKKRRQNLREGLLAFSAGLNAASAGYSSSETNTYGSASYSGSSNSNTNVYGSNYGYLGSFDTNTRSSGTIYGSSSSYTTSYDGAAAYAASQNEQAKLNAFIQASEENKRRWNEEYLRNHTLNPQETISGLLNVKYYKSNRVDLVITTNDYDYVFQWDPNDAEN